MTGDAGRSALCGQGSHSSIGPVAFETLSGPGSSPALIHSPFLFEAIFFVIQFCSGIPEVPIPVMFRVDCPVLQGSQQFQASGIRLDQALLDVTFPGFPV